MALSVARKALTQYRGTPYEKPLRDAFEKLTSGLRDQIHFAWGDLDNTISFRAAGRSVGPPGHLRGRQPGRLALRGAGIFLPKTGQRGREETPPGAAAASGLHRQPVVSLRLRSGARREHPHLRAHAHERVARGGPILRRPEDFSLDEHLAGSFGVFSSPTPAEVHLRFDAFSAHLELGGGPKRRTSRPGRDERLERAASAGTTAIPPAGSASSSSAFARAMFSSSRAARDGQGDRGDDADVRLRDLRREPDLAGAAHAHLRDDDLGVRLDARQRERQADLVVEARLGGDERTCGRRAPRGCPSSRSSRPSP